MRNRLEEDFPSALIASWMIKNFENDSLLADILSSGLSLKVELCWVLMCCGWFFLSFFFLFLLFMCKNSCLFSCGVYQLRCCTKGFKVMYTDSSSSFSLARRLSLPFQTLHERLPSIWLNIPNTRTRWFSRTSLCLPMASPAPASSWRALWLCADHFWDLFCYRLRWLVHWDRNVSPTSRTTCKHRG